MNSQLAGNNQKGFGPIFLLTILLITGIPALIWMLARSVNIKAENAPKILITNSLSLGSISIWGAVLLTLGFIPTLGFLMAGIDKAGTATFCCVILPLLVNGILFLIYASRYNKKFGSSTYQNNSAMNKTNGNNGKTTTTTVNNSSNGSSTTKTTTTTTTIVNGAAVNMEEIQEMLGKDPSNINVQDVLSKIDFFAQAGSGGSEKQEPTPWTCQGCGATDNVGNKCEYCGGAPSK